MSEPETGEVKSGAPGAALFQSLLKNYLRPVLREAGFKGSGATLRLTGSGPTSVMVRISRLSGTDAEISFVIRWAVMSVAASEYWHQWCPGAKEDTRTGVYGERLEAPEGLRNVQFDPSEWLFKAEDLDSYGQAVARHLKEQVVPFWVSLLDPARVVEMLPAIPDPRREALGQGMRPVMKWLLIYIDTADVDEVRAKLDEADALLGDVYVNGQNVDGRLRAWLRNRFEQRTANIAR